MHIERFHLLDDEAVEHDIPVVVIVNEDEVVVVEETDEILLYLQILLQVHEQLKVNDELGEHEVIELELDSTVEVVVVEVVVVDE